MFAETSAFVFFPQAGSCTGKSRFSSKAECSSGCWPCAMSQHHFRAVCSNSLASASLPERQLELSQSLPCTECSTVTHRVHSLVHTRCVLHKDLFFLDLVWLFIQFSVISEFPFKNFQSDAPGKESFLWENMVLKLGR